MSDSGRAQALRKLLVSRYSYLAKRLERVTGSKDGAADALHETWMRLESANIATPVANGDAYLLGMANMRGLTPRRRAILLAARVDGQLNREIAEQYGISLRLVESELSAAMKYCLKRMQETGDPYAGSTAGPRKF
jgi:RNA polymerase sigma-70 factor (ECF subfamily)